MTVERKVTEGNFEFSFLQIGAVVIQPKVYNDHRGYFQETYNADAFQKAGVPHVYVQDNHSFSTKGVLRGLHYQKPTWQGKLVRVTRGRVYDAIVDIRIDSPTFGAWYGIELSAELGNMLYVPEGFAHGFLALEDSEFLYKCTNTYVPKQDGTILYDSVGIHWNLYASRYGISEFNLSRKDLEGVMTLDQFRFKSSL